MHGRTGIAAVTILTLLLNGCSAAGPGTGAPNTPVPPAAAPTTATPTSTPTPTGPAKNARGNIVKQVGDAALIVNTEQGNKPVITYVVKSITPNFKCTSQYAPPADNGNFIAVTMDITTGPAEDLQALNVSDAGMLFWKVITADGTTENEVSTGATYMCLKATQGLPTSIGPGEHVVGVVVLDAKSTKGAIVMYFGGPTGIGWEYSF